MSAPIDDKALDEYLSGRSRLSQRYRALADDAGETVPPELDRRILAQARNAVAQAAAEQVDELTQLRTKRRRLMQWGVPTALAASAVLVISIVIRSGVQHEVQAVHERSVTVPAAAAPPAPPAPPPVAARQQSADANTQDGVVLIAPPQNAATEFSPLAPPPAAAAKEVPGARRNATRLPAPAAPQEALKAERSPAAAQTAAVDAQRVQQPSQNSPMPTTAMQSRQAVASSATPPPDPAAPAAMASAGEQRVVASPPAEDQRARYESTAAKARAEYERGDLPEVAATSAARQSSTAADGGVLDAPVPGATTGAPPSGDKLESVDLHSDPRRWLEHIRELRQNGRNTEADSDWKEFRARYPDYPVTEADAASSKP